MRQDPDQPDFILLSWKEPYYISGDLKNYMIYYKSQSDNKWTTIPLPGVFNSYKISDFKPGSKYSGFIVPFDSNGAGLASNNATVVTVSGE